MKKQFFIFALALFSSSQIMCMNQEDKSGQEKEQQLYSILNLLGGHNPMNYYFSGDWELKGVQTPNGYIGRGTINKETDKQITNPAAVMKYHFIIEPKRKSCNTFNPGKKIMIFNQLLATQDGQKKVIQYCKKMQNK